MNEILATLMAYVVLALVGTLIGGVVMILKTTMEGEK